MLKRENYLKRKQLLEDRIEKYHKEIYRFCLDFIDVLNEDLTPIKEKNGFSELYLNYDLTLTIQKTENHKIVVCGREHTANLKIYKFEQLNKDAKLEILTKIKENFKKEYYKIMVSKREKMILSLIQCYLTLILLRKLN